MDNIITITLKEKPEKNYNVKFESSPTVSELCASILVLQEVLEHNFDRQTILNKMASIYGRLQDIEELYKDSTEVEALDQNGNKVKIITRG